MRILNREQVVSHGFEEGRRIVTDIMEHGLQAADPYVNTSRLLHLEGNRLYVGDAGLRPITTRRRECPSMI